MENEDVNNQEGSYLVLNADHMAKISQVHIKLNLIAQIASIINVFCCYVWSALIHFKEPDGVQWETDSWITTFKIQSPEGAVNWYWDYKLDSSVTCTETGFSSL